MLSPELQLLTLNYSITSKRMLKSPELSSCYAKKKQNYWHGSDQTSDSTSTVQKCLLTKAMLMLAKQRDAFHHGL